MKRLIFVFLGFLTAISGFSQSNTPNAATINLVRDEHITVSQFFSEVEHQEKQANRVFTHDERIQVLNVMINERLVLQASERDRITVTENEINQQIQQLRSSMEQQLGRQPTDAEFAQAVMNEIGVDVPAFRDQLRRQMIVQKYLIAKKGDLINSAVAPTENEIIAEYNLLRNELIRPDTVRVSIIFVPYGADSNSRTRAGVLANSLVREINNDPIKFDEVTARSAEANSGYRAGDAGYLPRNNEAIQTVGQDFMNVAFNLRLGQVSRLIEGLQGFQIIKVTETYASRQLELTDIIQLGTNTTVRNYIGQLMLNQRQQVVLARASQELVDELRSSGSFQIFENNIRR